MFNKNLIGVLSFFIFGFILFFARGSVSAATFTVTNTNDSGAGSLRQAIIDSNANANSPTVDDIEFNIAGSGEHEFTPATEYPSITEPVAINGFSQSGSSANSAAAPQPFNAIYAIALNGINTDAAFGIEFADGAAGSSLTGLCIYNFKGNGSSGGQVSVIADSVTVAGNFIGLEADGLTVGQTDGAGRSETAIYVGSDADGTVVGGTDPADRNIISGSSNGVGTFVTAGSNTSVFGNFVGVGKDGLSYLGGKIGTATTGGSVTYGGSTANKRNVITGHDTVNLLLLPASTSVIQGNYIGTDYTGNYNSSLTKGGGVVMTASASGNLIGGIGAGEGNTISGGGSAVGVILLTLVQAGFPLVSTNNAILGNSIKDVGTFNYPGFGTSNLGIDLYEQIDTSDPSDYVPEDFASTGPNTNDAGDSDSGANGYINTPVLKTAVQEGANLTIEYDLDAADSPTDRYRVEFFANDASTIFSTGPGQTYLGAVTSSENGTGLEVTLNGIGADYTDKALSATATAINASITTTGGFGSTSEFSSNISIGSTTDTDADGVPDALEDLAPNNGDGNNDGTPDKSQPRVTSFLDYDSRFWVTFITEGCNENAAVMAIDAASLPSKDNGYEYIYGMTDFTLNCSKAETVNVTKFIHDPDTDISKFLPRKYNPNTGVFASLTNATIGRETVGTSNAIKLAYSVTDGGTHDDDGEENGIIVDPVGLASESSAGSGLLANTGIFTALAIPVGLLLIVGAIYTYTDYRKHKKPLLEANPKDAKTYTYWHHIKVVSIPVARYRVKVMLEKKEYSTSTPS